MVKNLLFPSSVMQKRLRSQPEFAEIITGEEKMDMDVDGLSTPSEFRVLR